MQIAGLGAAGSIVMLNLATNSTTQFTAGDPFVLQITGAAPNSPISVTAANYSNPSQGTTDASGNYTLNDITPNAPGSVSQTWSVAGQPVAPSPLTFTILAPATSAAQQAAATSGTSAGQATAAAALATISGSGSFLTQTISLLGYNVPVWMLGAGAAALILLMPTGGRR